METMRRLLIAVATLAVVGALGLWLVCQSAIFSELRRSYVADILSSEIGQDFLITGDARIALGWSIRVTVEDARIPSDEHSDKDLARLQLAAFSISLVDALNGEWVLSDIALNDLNIAMVKDEEGKTTWKDYDLSSLGDQDGNTIFRFLHDKNVHVANVSVIARNAKSGFETLLNLEWFWLDYTGMDTPVSLSSVGHINGKPFDIKGNFPRGEPFSLDANLGRQELTITGNSLSNEDRSGFIADIDLSTDSLANLQETAGLRPGFNGVGTLTTRVRHVPGVLELSGFEVATISDKSISLKVSGAAKNLFKLDGINAFIETQLQPDDVIVEQAETIADLKILSIEGRIASEMGRFEFLDVEAVTNDFAADLKRIGSARAGRLRRTSEGLLSLEEISIQAEREAFKATGRIGDLLGFNDLYFEGTILGKADMWAKAVEPEVVQAIGEITAEFRISDANGALSIEHFAARNKGSDLWSLKANLAIHDLFNLAKTDILFDLTVGDGAALMRSLLLPPINVGRMRVTLEASSESSNASGKLGLELEHNVLEIALSHRKTSRKNVVRGEIESDELDISRLTELIQSVSKISGLKRTDSSKQLFSDQRTPMPMVLPPEGREVLPMVVEPDAGTRHLANMLRKLDVEIGLEFRKLTGSPNFSGIDTSLRIKRGQAALGPIDVQLGGAHGVASIAADLMNEPYIARASGTVTNWEFSKLVDLLGTEIDADGVIGGDFELTTQIAPPVDLLRNTTGWALLNMKEGLIGTSLIDLAGLGVFPWLFSSELAQGSSRVVCLVAPLTINRGRFSSNALVLETESVQLIANGWLDLPRQSVNVRAVPRPVGRPLAASAWPFDIKGSLDNPQIEIGGGGDSREPPGKEIQIVDHTPCKIYNFNLR